MSMDLTNWINWIPSVSTTSLLALVLYLARNLLEVRLKNSVKHDYDRKIELLKTDLRNSEESFKAELKVKESQIDALRSGALSGLVNRQAALYERRLEAVNQLWGAITSLQSAKTISLKMSAINFETAEKISADDPRVREMFEVLAKGFDANSMDTKEASLARPFISPLAWALFSAYASIISYAVLKIMLLQKGLGKNLINVEAIMELVKVALPHQKNYIEEHGPDALHYLLEDLENKILSELEKILNGEESDKESVKQAALILKETNRFITPTSNVE